MRFQQLGSPVSASAARASAPRWTSHRSWRTRRAPMRQLANTPSRRSSRPSRAAWCAAARAAAGVRSAPMRPGPRLTRAHAGAPCAGHVPDYALGRARQRGEAARGPPPRRHHREELPRLEGARSRSAAPARLSLGTRPAPRVRTAGLTAPRAARPVSAAQSQMVQAEQAQAWLEMDAAMKQQIKMSVRGLAPACARRPRLGRPLPARLWPLGRGLGSGPVCRARRRGLPCGSAPRVDRAALGSVLAT